jgi:hypothetical protein
MLTNINSNLFFLKIYNFINLLFYKNFKLSFKLFFFKKINLKNYFFIKTFFLNNYFFFFKSILKINNFFFIKCVNLVLYSYLYKYINIIFFLVKNNYNFYFISENYNFNLFWSFDIIYLKNNLTKANFMRFFIKFFKKNNIKFLIFVDFFFINFLSFFKKLNIITAGLITVFFNTNHFNYPIFLLDNNLYNSYFLYNITYDIYLIGVLHKYNIILLKFFKNFFKLNRLLYII